LLLCVLGKHVLLAAPVLFFGTVLGVCFTVVHNVLVLVGIPKHLAKRVCLLVPLFLFGAAFFSFYATASPLANIWSKNMKKFLNNPENFVDESLKTSTTPLSESNYCGEKTTLFVSPSLVKGKSRIVTGGGIRALAFILVLGDIVDEPEWRFFPNRLPLPILESERVCGTGVFTLYGNYRHLSFDMR